MYSYDRNKFYNRVDVDKVNLWPCGNHKLGSCSVTGGRLNHILTHISICSGSENAINSLAIT
jgi:hypothetical protein